MKKYYVWIPLVLILVLASTGCSKTEPEQIVSEQPSSITEEITEEVSEEGSGEGSEEGTKEGSNSSQVETETVLGNDGSVSITSKDSEGKVVAKINYDASTNITEKYIYEYDEKGNLKRELKYTAEGNVANQFMVDDYVNADSFAEINYDVPSDYTIDTDNAFTVTIEELAPLYNKAEEMWDTYGVIVLIADKVSDHTEGAELCFEYEVIQRSLNLVEGCLECYPENFFRDFSGDVCIQLVGMGSTAGGYMGGYEHLLIQMDVNCYNPTDEYDDEGAFFCYTLHHEIFHMISEMLMERAFYSDCPLSEERWNSYNPEGFVYVNGYDNEKEAQIYCSGNNFDYFLGSYGCSFPDEDRAMIFGEAMAYYQGYEYMKFTDYVNAKLKYLSDCIRAGFQSDSWGDIAPWDYMMYR